MDVSKVIAWFGVHWEVAWPIVSAVVLAVAKRRTPEEWIALGERSPRVQGVLRFLRAAGFDTTDAMRGVMQIVTGRVAASTTPAQRERADVLASILVADAPASTASVVSSSAAVVGAPPARTDAGATATTSSAAQPANDDGGAT